MDYVDTNTQKNDIHTSAFHSVLLDRTVCKGCTVCITSCPVEAIRIRGGKAHILEERCIDCGECIRRCPHFAKKACTLELAVLEKYHNRIALIAPSIYAQFPLSYSIEDIRNAFVRIGFTAVVDVAQAAQKVSAQTAQYLASHHNVKPFISSACPTVIKLIQIRFPTLTEHILPLLPPVEIAAQEARIAYPENTGVFFISPCPSKMTAARTPLGFDNSSIDGVFSIADVYMTLMTALKEKKVPVQSINEKNSSSETPAPRIPYHWACTEGELSELEYYTQKLTKKNISSISSDGIYQVIQTLEALEDGTLSHYDFIEMSSCQGGCIGGPLTLTLQGEARFILKHKSHSDQTTYICDSTPDSLSFYFTKDIEPRPSLLLDSDYEKARLMMEDIETLYHSLPGLDCGSCGSPNCHALAEDIVRSKSQEHTVQRSDCIFVLREQYEKLLLRSTCRLRLQKHVYREAQKQTLNAYGQQAASLFEQTALYQNADTLLLFLSTMQELDTMPLLLAAQHAGKKIALPRVISTGTSANMEFYYIDANKELSSQIEKGHFGLMEPLKTQCLFPLDEHSPLFSSHTVMVLPGLAFSEKGLRLGKGGGYYDRFFARLPTLPLYRVGFCFDTQIIDDIPSTERDITMTHIISDKRFIMCDTHKAVNNFVV